MTTTQTYKVLFNNVTVKSSTSLLSSTLGKLKKDTIIEVLDVRGFWARFKYNNKDAYIITLYLEKVEQVITGSITIKYLYADTNIEVLPTVTNDNLSLNIYSYTAPYMEDYTVIEPSIKSVTLTKSNPNQEIIFYYKKNITADSIYIIDLKKYGISNDNTNGNATTIGINKALVDAKTTGYKRVQLPEGIYSIDTSVKNPIVLSDGTNNWTHNRQGLCMLSDMELILEGATLQMIPCEDPYYSIVTISNCKNSKITGGTIIGDRETHDYGMRINESGNMFESGDFDSATGEPKVDDTKVRTKDFIDIYKDWFTGKKEPLPTNFYIIPLWNTTMNTVDGGCRYIYCYDKDGKYLGLTTGGIGFIKQATLIPNTAKIKISIRGEKRLDIVLAMTKRMVYFTYEFGSGLTVTDSDTIEINGTTIKDCIGDCVCTIATSLKNTVDNLKIVGCTLENARRQGISFVATGENYLVQGCNIGKINGTDPQCGIDFEHYDYMKNTVIDNCNFYDNKKWDIINYNGTNIEIKNSNFTGAIATTYGHSMDIHNNIFEYRDSKNKDKIFKKNSLALGTENNLVYNNEFIEGSVSNSGKNSNTYNNIFKNVDVNITSSGQNEYYNSSVGISQNENFSKLENNYFKNCNVFNHNDSPSIEITNCTFENSSYNARGETLITNCTFNMNDKSIIDGWKTDQTKITYRNCNIISNYTSEIRLLGTLNTIAIFEDCTFNISRYLLTMNYGTLAFNNCKFLFNNLNANYNAIELNQSGYGFERCPWYFNNCYFESDLPINIYGGNVVNPTIIGNIKIL